MSFEMYPSFDRFPGNISTYYNEPRTYNCACGAQGWESDRRRCKHCGEDCCEECCAGEVCARCKRKGVE